jgi:hypothetical protein
VLKLTFSFLGALAKLQKATISFVMSVRLSVRMEQIGFRCTNFHKILYLSICRKSVEKIQASLKFGKTSGALHGDQYAFLIVSH